MKKIVLLTILFAAFFVPSQYAKAVDLEGFYIGATGAADFLSNVGFSNSGYSGYGYGHRHLKFDTGFFGAIDLGYRWCNGLHLEAEVAYRYNRERRRHFDYSTFGYSGSSRRGHRDVWAAMVNVLYDINTCWGVDPYVGVGLGYAHVRYKRPEIFNGASFGPRRHYDDNDFAWQVIAGVAYPIMCNVDVAVEYRFFNAVNDRRHQKNAYNNDIGVNLKYYF